MTYLNMRWPFSEEIFVHLQMTQKTLCKLGFSNSYGKGTRNSGVFVYLLLFIVALNLLQINTFEKYNQNVQQRPTAPKDSKC